MTNSNRLYRSRTDKVIGGVSGGLADYINIDPVVVRILFVLLAVFGGSGVLVYIILWIVIPEQPIGYRVFEEKKSDGSETVVDVDIESNPENSIKKTNTSLVAGILLIVFGLALLLSHLIPAYNLLEWWPLLLILAGVLLLKPEILKTSKNIES